jgi:hypothetical protein
MNSQSQALPRCEMNRPPKCTRRLIVLTEEASNDLSVIARRLCLNNSMAVREALHLAADHLRNNPPQVVKTLIPEADHTEPTRESEQNA